MGALAKGYHIYKFKGSYTDCPRFWGQFFQVVDKSNIATISKFTYLLDLKVKRSVEALGIYKEGYNRAQTILGDRHGKESKRVKSYVKEVTDQPNVASNNPKKITEFSERLSYSVFKRYKQWRN